MTDDGHGQSSDDVDSAETGPPEDPKRSVMLIAGLAFGFMACMCIFIAVVALLRATSL